MKNPLVSLSWGKSLIQLLKFIFLTSSSVGGKHVGSIVSLYSWYKGSSLFGISIKESFLFLSSTKTFHWDRPWWGLISVPLNADVISTISSSPFFPCVFSISATTASSSIGFKEQVEYMIYPPTLRRLIPLFKIWIWSLWRLNESFVDQFFHLCGSFRITASLEHGTSAKILSNKTLSSLFAPV